MPHLAALACLLTFLILCARGWWRFAPAFMCFAWCNCLQRCMALADAPHDLAWRQWVWAPAEIPLLLSAVAATAEILFWRTRYMRERLFWRVACITAPLLIVGAAWHIEPGSLYGWVVRAREFVWGGIFLACWILVFPGRFATCEPSALRLHSYIFTALAFAHAVIAPISRHGVALAIPQAAYQAILVLCCARWALFCVTRRPEAVAAAA